MVSDHFNDNEKMLAYGRKAYKASMIRKHKEAIRNLAVAFQNVEDSSKAKELNSQMSSEITQLIEALDVDI